MDPQEGRIESWKAIADYVRCDTTTAMRWEKERGLPVHRHPGEKRSRVYAFHGELDAWLQRGPTQEMVEGTPSSDTAEGGEAAWSVSAPLRESGAPGGQVAPTRESPRPWTRHPLILAGVVGAALLGLIGAIRTQNTVRLNPISLRVEGATLEAIDNAGRSVWTRAFPKPFKRMEWTKGEKLDDRSWVGDLDGDGQNEVLFLAEQPAGDGSWEDTLHCFDAAGRERWSFRLQETFRFGKGDFGPPWFSGLVTVYEVGAEKRVALSLAHQTWWPAPLLTFNPRGERLSTFMSSGVIYQLRTTIRGGRPLILAGGVSNSREAASLIVLDGANVVGTTPEDGGSDYECLSCPAGQPFRYFSFPKTDLAVAARNPYNGTDRVRTTDSGVVVNILEVANTLNSTGLPAVNYFEFDEAFNLKNARWGDSVPRVHEAYEDIGALTHSSTSCPHRTPRVRIHQPGRGLVELKRGVSPSGNGI